MNAKLVSVEVASVAVSPKTSWVFARVTDASGAHGFGEATLDGKQVEVAAMAMALGGTLVDRNLSAGGALSQLPRPQSLTQAAAVSGLDQALHDLIARHKQCSVAALIGTERRAQVPLYANINRRTKDRSPAGFAAVAQRAVEAGFNAFKIAPFDEVEQSGMNADSFIAALDAGLARIAAVRQVVGPKSRLMVDCHWRFNELGASAALNECAQFNLHWLECPVPEDEHMLPAIARLRKQAHLKGMLLAGGENIIGLGGLTPFLEAGAYDVIMPDVKYVGGLATMLRIGAAQQRAEVAFAPHNPSGPVAHAASLEVCAAAVAVDYLEIQFDETPMFDGVLSQQGRGLSRPTVTLSPQRHGLGVCVSPDLFNKDGSQVAAGAAASIQHVAGF